MHLESNKQQQKYEKRIFNEYSNQMMKLFLLTKNTFDSILFIEK